MCVLVSALNSEENVKQETEQFNIIKLYIYSKRESESRGGEDHAGERECERTNKKRNIQRK